MPAGLSREKSRRRSCELAPVCSTLLSHPKEKRSSSFLPIGALVLRDSALVSRQLQFSRCRRAPPAADTVSHRVFQLPRPVRRHDCLIGSSYFRGNYYHSDYVNHSGSLLLRVAPNSSSSSSRLAAVSFHRRVSDAYLRYILFISFSFFFFLNRGEKLFKNSCPASLQSYYLWGGTLKITNGLYTVPIMIIFIFYWK